MPFGVKTGPPTFERVVSKVFKEYLDQFMKIFLDDFIVYNDLESHLMKLNFAFRNAENIKSVSIQKKCAFMVFLGLILGYIIFKEGKIPNLKKV
jgi:hypothetical protein